jgi:tripartite-type tricarboxylate transporter receptor subunit TctC
MSQRIKKADVPCGRFTLSLMSTLMGVWMGATPASAQDVEKDPFFENRSIVFLIPAGSGGNLDYSGRLIGRYLSKYIPGHPNFVVQNMPGGGGMTMSNYLYNVAPKDGSAIGLVYQTAGLDQMLGSQAKYVFGNFGWIGRLSSSTALVVIHDSAPAKTLAAMKDKEVIFGSIGKTSQSTYVPTLLRTVLGYKTRVIYGYKGAADTFLAMERGEVHARTGSLDSLMATKPLWLKDGQAHAVAELSLESKPSVPGIPLMRDLATTDEQREILDFMASYTAFGVAFAAPPGIPANRLKILRQAFDRAVNDPELKAELEKGQFAYDPKSGDYLQDLAVSFSAAKPDLIERVKAALD